MVGADVGLTVKIERVIVAPSCESKLALWIPLILSLYHTTLQRRTLKRTDTQYYKQLWHFHHWRCIILEWLHIKTASLARRRITHWFLILCPHAFITHKLPGYLCGCICSMCSWWRWVYGWCNRVYVQTVHKIKTEQWSSLKKSYTLSNFIFSHKLYLITVISAAPVVYIGYGVNLWPPPHFSLFASRQVGLYHCYKKKFNL